MKKIKQFAICFSLVLGLWAGSVQGMMVLSDTGDLPNGDPMPQYLFSQFTTVAGGPFNNIEIAWRALGDPDPMPNTFFADGQIHVSTTPFTTSFAAAGTHTGVIMSCLDTGDQYTCPVDGTLQGNTTYYFAMDATAPTSSNTAFSNVNLNGNGSTNPDTLISSLDQVAEIGSRVLGTTTVPEPSSFLFMGVMALTLIVGKRFLGTGAQSESIA